MVIFSLGLLSRLVLCSTWYQVYSYETQKTWYVIATVSMSRLRRWFYELSSIVEALSRKESQQSFLEGFAALKSNESGNITSTRVKAIARNNLFGPCRLAFYGSEKIHWYQLLEASEEVVLYKPGCNYKMDFAVGDGGGLSVYIESFRWKIITRSIFQEDPTHTPQPFWRTRRYRESFGGNNRQILPVTKVGWNMTMAILYWIVCQRSHVETYRLQCTGCAHPCWNKESGRFEQATMKTWTKPERDIKISCWGQ